MQIVSYKLMKCMFEACKSIKSINRVSVKRGKTDITSNINSIVRSHGSERKKLEETKKSSMISKGYLPYYTAGKVVAGFGRGSKSLGCPTANFPEDVVEALPAEFETGVYYGWASLENKIYKMVMSIGWNPFYNNDKKSMEVHLLHKFTNDFYGKDLKVIILGYIRPEMNFTSVDDLIKAINNDIEVSKKSLDESSMVQYKEDPFLNS